MEKKPVEETNSWPKFYGLIMMSFGAMDVERCHSSLDVHVKHLMALHLKCNFYKPLEVV